MFEQAKLKRESLNTRLNNFFKFKEGNATVAAGFLTTSAQKRRKIEDNLNRWSSPYAQTGFELARNAVDLSMSFRFSQSNFKHVTHPPEENKDQSMLRKELERQFYESDNHNRSDIPENRELAETIKPEPGSPVQERYNPSKQEEFKPIVNPSNTQQPLIESSEPLQPAVAPQPPVIQPLDHEAMVLHPDQPETERPQAQHGVPEQHSNIESDRVQVNNNLTLGQSVFNYLDLSMSNRPEGNPFAETIKAIKLEPAGEVVAEQHTSEKVVAAPQSPDKGLQNSAVKENSSGLANNSSQGIFLSEDFKDFIDRKHSDSNIPASVTKPKEDVHLSVVVEAPAELQPNTSEPAEVDVSPPPRQSLFTDPNEEAHLRESLTLSIFDKVFAEKIGAQLVVDLEDVTLNKFEREISRKRFAQLVERKVEVSIKIEARQLVQQISQVRRLAALKRRVRHSTLFEHFLHIKLYREYRENKVRRRIAVQRYREVKTHRRIEKIFKAMRDVTRAHKRWLEEFRRQSESNLLYTALKHWKMYWFHKRIKNEVKQFRLSTIFGGWRKAADKQRRQDEHIAIRFYYEKALERGFILLQQAVRNSQVERHNQQRAESFCYLRQLRTVFDAWRDVAEQLADQKNNRDYIPIEMTVKNKLMTGNQLLKTREVQINVLK